MTSPHPYTCNSRCNSYMIDTYNMSQQATLIFTFARNCVHKNNDEQVNSVVRVSLSVIDLPFFCLQTAIGLSRA
jgi:hypothetical protein